MTNRSITASSPFHEFARYVSLNVTGMLGLSCYILADTFFIARGLGAEGLAALNLAIPVYSFVHGSGLMLGMGGGTRYSIFRGQKGNDNGNVIFTHTVFAAAILALVFVLTGLLGAGWLTAALGGEGRVGQMTRTYLTVILLFSPAFIMNDVLLCFVRNDGAPRLAMKAMLGGSFSNVILDYIFIFPCGMGIFGAVLATGLAPVISMGILSSHLRKKRNGFHFTGCRLEGRLLGSELALGFPSLITEVSSGIVIIVFNQIIMGLQGNTGVAAYGVIANLSLVAAAVFTGIAQGIQPIISTAYGTGDREKTGRLLGYGLKTMGSLVVLIYLGLFAFTGPVTAVFNSEGNQLLQEIAEKGLRLYFLAAPFMGFNIVISSYYTSVDQALPAHIISILRGLALIVPAAYVMARLFGMTGVWLAVPVTEAVVAGAGAWWLLKSSNQSKN